MPCSTPDREGKARDEWVINGVKTRVTNGGIANVHVVIASVDPDLGPVERWHRDAKIFTIFEGTSEIQRMLIGRAITGLDVR